MFSTIHAAFSFLSILVKGKIYNDRQMQQSIYYYPLVGAIIGFIASSIIMLCYYFSFSKELCAIIFLLIECFLSRGLHHDGLSDIADAIGSNKTQEKFREVLKDSRIGSFGVIALLSYFLLTTFAIAQLINLQSYNSFFPFISLMTLGCMWSRLGLICLPAYTKLYIPNNAQFSLAKTMFCQFQKKYFYYWLIFFLLFITIYFTFSMVIILFTITFIFTYPLYKIAKRENGYNGDFLGATCLLWECSFYLAGIIILT